MNGHCELTQLDDGLPDRLKIPLNSPYRRKPIVVGISGATNAGKTTVANRLLAEFPGSEIIHQDDFFRSPDDPAHEHVEELNHHNWDTFSSINVDSLIATAKRKLANLESSLARDALDAVTDSLPKLLILEGILILNIPQLFVLLDKKYYLTLTLEECRRRRLTRNYDPPDVPGYFDAVVWPMHVKLSVELRRDRHDIEYLSGLLPSDAAFRFILADLNAIFNSNSATKAV